VEHRKEIKGRDLITRRLNPYDVSMKLEKEGIKIYSKKPKGWKLIESGSSRSSIDNIMLWGAVRKSMEKGYAVKVVEPSKQPIGLEKYYVYIKEVI
jgi:hypothetical protein